MDQRKAEEIKKEAARQAAVGASGGMERPDENEERSDLPKPPVAVEAPTAAQEDGERQPYAKGASAGSTEASPDAEPARGAPAVKTGESR